MKLIFARSHMPGSYLIRWLSFSKWSHVAAIHDNGVDAIEATWPRVRKATVQDIIEQHTAYEIRELNMSTGAWGWFETQVGKRYDLMFLFAFLNPWRDWTTDDKWACSELIAAASGLFFGGCRVSPQMLYLLSKPVV